MMDIGYKQLKANQGWRKALASDPGFLDGLNIHAGKITCAAVAAPHGLAYTAAANVI
jgi:alanine dehydrogenase